LQPIPPPRILVALPAYNEEANVGSLLHRIHGTLTQAGLAHSIVVVDDGSRDRTPEILSSCAQTLPLIVETHASNQGLGGALRDALKRASASAAPGDVIVTMDSDESHSPELILPMVKRVQEGCDVVIASRYQPGSRVEGLALHRVWISSLAGVLLRALFPTPGVRDYTCGFRAYRSEALQLAYARYGDSLVDQSGFPCMVDVLLKMRRLPLVFGEVPMRLRYDLKRGASKMRLLQTSLATLRLLWKRRLGE
jgi:dolichol-phosphate mannosyltransferase